MAADPQNRFTFDSQNAPTNDDCPVCHETYVHGDEIVCLNCGHDLHFFCWNKVRARACIYFYHHSTLKLLRLRLVEAGVHRGRAPRVSIVSRCPSAGG